MPEIMVIFSLAATGSLVRLSLDFALQFVARRTASDTTASGPLASADPQSRADPLVAVGLTLSSYGAIALGLVLALPGALAAQRSWLAFSLLCVGGLIGEICRTRSVVSSDPEVDDESYDGIPASVGLSMTLTLAMNLAMALLVSGQGLVVIVPPAQPVAQAQTTELEPIVVVAGRGSDPLANSSTFL